MRSPKTLAGLVPDAQIRDAWSATLRVRPAGDDDVEIASAGADRRFDTLSMFHPDSVSRAPDRDRL